MKRIRNPYYLAAALSVTVGLIGSAFVAGSALMTEADEPEITLGTPASPDAEEMSIKEVAALTMPSMAAITNTTVEEVRSYYSNFGFGFGFGFDDFFNEPSTRTYESVSMGTGVIIGMTDDYVLIATNEHVVSGATSLSAAFIDESVAEAQVIGKNKTNDLAVVKVAKDDLSRETLDAIKVVTLGTNEGLMVGEEVVAIGNALGYGQSVSAGIVSALNRSLSSTNSTTGESEMTGGMIQTDASINPGNSGGALLNRKGELIGINSAKYADTSVEGMGFAIPIDTALPILESIAERLSSNYVAAPVTLGITGTDVTYDSAEYYGIPQGVYVNSVEPGGPADIGGLEEGDIITAIDSTQIYDMDDLSKALEDYSVGDTAKIAITRITRSSGYMRRLRSGTLTVTFEEDLFAGLETDEVSAA